MSKRYLAVPEVDLDESLKYLGFQIIDNLDYHKEKADEAGINFSYIELGEVQAAVASKSRAHAMAEEFKISLEYFLYSMNRGDWKFADADYIREGLRSSIKNVFKQFKLHTIELFDDTELTQMYMNAKKTYWSAGGHGKAARNENAAQTFYDEMVKRNVSIPNNDCVSENGVFNGPGAS